MVYIENYPCSLAEPARIADYLDAQHNNITLQKAGCEAWSCAWSPDGSYFAWSQGNRIVKLLPWNKFEHTIIPGEKQNDNHKTVTIYTGELVWALAFGSKTADTKPNSINLNWYRYHDAKDLILATGLNSGRIRIWEVKTGQLMLELLDHKEVIRDLKFAPDRSLRLASASRDGTIKCWDLDDDGNMYKTLKADSKWLYSCTWSPDAKMLVSVGDSKSVIIWDMTSLERLRRLTGHHHDVCSCEFSPDGALLATSSYDTRIIIWDPHTGIKLQEFGHLFPPPSPIFAGGANGAYVRDVAFCHDGRHVASICDDLYVRFWDIEDESAPAQVAMINNALCCNYSPDGAVLAVGTRDGNVTFFLSPMQVLSLQHLCRMAIRRILPSQHVPSLDIPRRLQAFLQYGNKQPPVCT